MFRQSLNRQAIIRDVLVQRCYCIDVKRSGAWRVREQTSDAFPGACRRPEAKKQIRPS
jgi:hypothetical protein